MRSRLSKVFAVLAIALTALGAVLVAPQDAHAAWRKGDKGWWWTENSAKGYATGWRKISGILLRAGRQQVHAVARAKRHDQGKRAHDEHRRQHYDHADEELCRDELVHGFLPARRTAHSMIDEQGDGLPVIPRTG